MNITHFTYAAGIASLLGLLLQVFNFFPKYSKIRNSISLIVFGVFLGSFIRAFDSSSIKVVFPIDGYSIIIAIFILVIISSLVTAFITKDSDTRGELFVVTFIAFFAFMFVLFMVVLIKSESLPIDQEKNKLSISELLLLVDDSKKKTNYDRAIMHLKSVKSRLGSDDPRKKVIEEKIKVLKLKQVE